MTQTAAPQAPSVDFWDCRQDCEQLSHTEIGEAIEAWADGLHPEPLPETVTVYGFKRLTLRPVERMANRILADVLERLDEDFGAPDDATEPTADMEAAALAFATAIRDGYAVWRCDEVTSVVEKVADHVPAEWLTPAAEVHP